VVESKDDMKKRGLSSPNKADAVASPITAASRPSLEKTAHPPATSCQQFCAGGEHEHFQDSGWQGRRVGAQEPPEDAKSFMAPSLASLGISDGEPNRLPDPTSWAAYDKYSTHWQTKDGFTPASCAGPRTWPQPPSTFSTRSPGRRLTSTPCLTFSPPPTVTWTAPSC